MSRYVDVDEITKDVKTFQDSFVLFAGATGGRKIVFTGKPADVRENIHARWEKPTGKIQPFGEDTRQCTGCGFFTDKDGCYVYNFCPSCGAIMDGEPKTTVKVEIKGEPISKTIADMREPKGEKGTE